MGNTSISTSIQLDLESTSMGETVDLYGNVFDIDQAAPDLDREGH